MWNAMFGTMLALVFAAGQLEARQTKAPPPDVGPGRIAWFDITTTNLSQSKEFYGKLFDWTFAAVQGSDQAVEIVARGLSIGTLRVADGKISPFNGVVYVQVNDIQASSAKAKELGGTIPSGFPFNLPDGTGSIALVVDPAGHPIGMYSRSRLGSKAPDDASIEERVRAFAWTVAENVSHAGPAAWQNYFSNSPHFFMASEGRVVFADPNAATKGIEQLEKTIRRIELKWGEPIRVDALAPGLAAVAMPYFETRTDSAGRRVDESGYFTAVAEFSDGRWQFRNAHWSVPGPPDVVP